MPVARGRGLLDAGVNRGLTPYDLWTLAKGMGVGAANVAPDTIGLLSQVRQDELKPYTGERRADTMSSAPQPDTNSRMLNMSGEPIMSGDPLRQFMGTDNPLGYIGEFFDPIGGVAKGVAKGVGLLSQHAPELLAASKGLLSALPVAAPAHLAKAGVPKNADDVYDLDFPITHDSSDPEFDGVITRKPEPYGVFDGIFGLEGYSGNAIGRGGYEHTYHPRKGKVAGLGDDSLDYDKSMAYLRKEYGSRLSDDELDTLYELTARDGSVFDDPELNVLKDIGFDDMSDASWEMQNIRGKLAIDQGFDAIAMSDENGVSYFIPYGSKAKRVAKSSDPASTGLLGNSVPPANLPNELPAPGGLLGGATTFPSTVKSQKGEPVKAVNAARAAAKPNPITVYHSTAADFDKFDPSQGIGGQMWFTSRKDLAETGFDGAQGKGRLVEAQVDIRNPAGWKEYEKYGIDELMSRGFDGIKLEDGNEISYVAFFPEQVSVKSNKPVGK